MSREWRPGDADLAIITWESPSGRSGGSGMAMRCSHEYNQAHWTTQMLGEVQDEIVTSWRPLVVIDPEDRESVERLIRLWGQQFDSWTPEPSGTNGDRMQAALREFANPTPPKPDEPTGLGAVVEDAEGKRWIRSADHGRDPWHSNGSRQINGRTWHMWSDLNVVRVLSEGVQ